MLETQHDKSFKTIAERLNKEPLDMIEQDSTRFLREYHYPSLELLNLSNDTSGDNITDELKNNAYTIIDTLKSFGIQTRIVSIIFLI